MHRVYSLLGVVIYGFYLIYDVQLLMNNKRFKYSEDDYIIAAINIYLDILLIFLKILELFGSD